jgi:hypothetical protein
MAAAAAPTNVYKIQYIGQQWLSLTSIDGGTNKQTNSHGKTQQDLGESYIFKPLHICSHVQYVSVKINLLNDATQETHCSALLDKY